MSRLNYDIAFHSLVPENLKLHVNECNDILSSYVVDGLICLECGLNMLNLDLRPSIV